MITHKRRTAVYLAVVLFFVAAFTIFGGVTQQAEAACGDSVSKTTSKTIHVDDAEAYGNDWTFSVKVWYDRCSNVTVINSLTYRYSVTGPAPCSSWFGVKQVFMNSGNIGGWNPGPVYFPCQNNDPADAKNIDAPNGTQIGCGNDNSTGAAVVAIRDNFPDWEGSVPLMSIPRPTNC